MQCTVHSAWVSRDNTQLNWTWCNGGSDGVVTRYARDIRRTLHQFVGFANARTSTKSVQVWIWRLSIRIQWHVADTEIYRISFGLWLMAQCVRVVEMSLEDEEVEIILTLFCASVTAFLATHSTSNRNVTENILMQLRYASDRSKHSVLFHMTIRCRCHIG